MNECERAKAIANRWLDHQYDPLGEMIAGDPDCDACVIARQYLRALEEIGRLKQDGLRRTPTLDRTAS